MQIRLRVILAALLAAMAVLSGATAATAAADTGTISGKVKLNGEPIPGVKFTITGEDGKTYPIATNEQGAWKVSVPAPGKYEVEMDTASLPQDVTLVNPDKAKQTKSVEPGRNAGALFPVTNGQSPDSKPDKGAQVLQLTVDGLAFGLIIALAAIGLSLIFGTTGLTNFSHGDLITFGALVAYFFNNVLGLPFILAAAGAVICSGIFGGLQDRFFWRWLRGRGTGLIAMLVISIGLGILLRYIYLFIFGGSSKNYAQYAGQPGIAIGPVDLTAKGMIGSAVCLLCIVLTALWLMKSRIGKASRAVADNPALASASGIDVERVINVVWILGTALAGLAGIIFALSNSVSWIFGFNLLLLVFAGVTLGGLGTAFGALVGSIVVGLFIQLSTLVIPSEMKNVGALLVLILVLLIRPQGLLGRRERVG